MPIGESFGDRGLTDFVKADLDVDGEAELLFVYIFGSGIERSMTAAYVPAINDQMVLVSPKSYLGAGYLDLDKINEQQVQVSVCSTVDDLIPVQS